jgi:hypothetical protein
VCGGGGGGGILKYLHIPLKQMLMKCLQDPKLSSNLQSREKIILKFLNASLQEFKNTVSHKTIFLSFANMSLHLNHFWLFDSTHMQDTI